ncbi:WecB/TagA/CpsF family glycosyltransferase [Aliikangiella marina]|uniref:WecB/TagA/CpsF family glycosyltransferase n=1 Tax=Aliikangiella marina TaxID=1712262 RepID=A0A545T9B6_9GAMM|nr:WecB/TagA/CpsF family glycosyltransferase [Aliikangiella marina]TQV73795.1 WecB/TagA/CpsF family glycosyltransferase [Aliikangiella marina]
MQNIQPNRFFVAPSNQIESQPAPELFREDGNNINVFNTSIWNGSMQNAVDWLVSRVQQHRKTTVAFANANNLNISVNNAALREHYSYADRVFADGSGIKLAGKILNKPVLDNVNGTDMFPLLCKALAKQGAKVYFLGAQKNVIDNMVVQLKQDYPGLKIVGHHHGYIGEGELDNLRVINQINRSNAEILLVAMGTPMQEHWLSKFAHKIQVPVRMSVGGLFDFVAKKVSRAPLWMRKAGLEWVWRTIQEPSRMWKRYILGNPLFVYRVVKQMLVQKMEAKFSHIAKLMFSPVKRVIDFCVASVALLLSTPILALTAIAIKLESRGNVLYSQTRIGKNGKPFKFYKFRSMNKNADAEKAALLKFNNYQDNVLFKMKKDPRITKVGAFIRKYSIDELPQLWNVINGEMTLVGPRPALPEEVAKYNDFERNRLTVKPGITCFWQVSGRSELSFKQQCQLDLKYIKERSIFTDFRILLMTIPAVISGKGAF